MGKKERFKAVGLLSGGLDSTLAVRVMLEVDCRIFLLRKAKAWMEEHGHHFVFTGEVVGQRPKSQTRLGLNTVERESGLGGYLIRPLSAKLLEPTVPELKGWVDHCWLF